MLKNYTKTKGTLSTDLSLFFPIFRKQLPLFCSVSQIRDV